MVSILNSLKNWQVITIGEIAEVKGGFAFPTEYQGEKQGDYPFYKVSDMNLPINFKLMSESNNWLKKETAQKLRMKPYPPKAIIFPKIGAAVATNKKRILTRESLIDNNVMAVIVKDCRLCDPDFLYQWFLSIDLRKFAHPGTVPSIPSATIKSHKIYLPPLEEQQKIAIALSLVQDAIAQQEQLITLTTELKKALMQKLFTEGTRGETQKMTEIGLIPESWNVVPLNDLLTLTQYGLSVKGEDSGNYPILRMTNQVNGKIVRKNLQYVEIKLEDFEKFKIEYGDILFNRTNSFELVGRTAIFDIDGNFVFASYLIRLRVNKEKLNPFFLNYYFNWDKTQIRLKGIATRAVSQSNISASRLKGFIIPLPRKLTVQDEIVKSLDYCDSKIAVHRQKYDILNDLFRTLLHQLMTAQIRVDDLNLSALNLELQETNQ